MGSTQGEIRVGPSHQAKLPENRANMNPSELKPDEEFLKEREEVRWIPSVAMDGDLVMFLRAARSMAAFAGMCDGGSAEDGVIAATRDETTLNALDVLHDCGYDKSKALQTLVKCPVPKSVEKRWAEEETKRFAKGLRQFGKNFFRIKKDLLPHKETPELVEFYYLWKKTPGANNNRPHRRRRQGSLRRNRNTRNTRGAAQKEEVAGNPRPSPGSKDQDASSGSDEDNDNSYDDSDSRENGGYRCQNCFTTSSRDWLHASNGPKQGLLLCHSCHTYYKQCGELPQTTKIEPYLFQPVQTDSPEGSPGRMRTRNKMKETPTKEKSKTKRSEVTTPEPEVEKKSDSKLPASKLKKGKTDATPHRKRAATSPGEDEVKRKKEHGPDSASEESSTESLADDIDAAISSPAAPRSLDENLPKSEVVLPTLVCSDENLEIKIEKNEPVLVDTSVVPVDQTITEKISSDTNETSITDDFTTPDVPRLSSPKVFDYVNDGMQPIKNETADERDEILPPVLTSEESYVPKDEMPTLHANTNMTETTTYQPTSTEMSAVKTEPTENTSAPESRTSTNLDSACRNPASPYSSRSISPNAVLGYGHFPAVGSPRAQTDADKGNVGQPLLLPRYPVYEGEEKKNEKAVAPSDLAPISLAFPHQAVPFPSYYHFPPHIPPHADKNNPSSLYLNEPPLQMEPQDLKIKQEIVPLDQPPPPLSVDPLQSLKEVKVPGYSDIPISQPLLITSAATNHQQSLNAADLRSVINRSEGSSPFATSTPIDEIKKESEPYSSSSRVATPAKSPAKVSVDTIARSVTLSPKLSHSPPYVPLTSQTSSSRTTISSPANVGGATIAVSQQPSPLNQATAAHLTPHPHAYMPPLHPHQQAAAAAAAYYQHPLFAQVAHAAAMHQFPHPHYPGYPYGFPYPTPYPIPQPIPPPRTAENPKRDGERSTTLVTSHHSSSSSSSVTTRSLRDDDSNMHAQEITQTHHRSSSHHASIHHHNEKQTISHSSSSSSSASVQHKVKRNSSPQHSSSTCHVSATLSQSTSSSVSTNHGQNTHHSHHHQHTHHHQSGESPAQLMNMSMPLVAPNKSHTASMLTGQPVLPPAHHPALSITGLQSPATGSLEALRAHAHAIHSPLLRPSSHGPLEDEDILSPTNYVPKGPSPEPKIEDNECHRSQSAIFLRHWNRGDYNSCARTDLTFKPVPDSKLDKKRQERNRKQAEKEREEREKSQTRKIVTPDKPESAKPPSRGPIESITSPYDRFARGTPYGDSTPALRQLSEYARPHTGFSPVGLSRSAASLALPPQCIDPMLHYQLNMYGPSPRERLEMEHFEREKRDRELRELREERLKEEMIKSAGTRLPNPMDQHWMDLRRFNALAPGAPNSLHPFSLYAAAGQPGSLSPLERERLERLASSAGPYPRPNLIPSREAALGLHPPPDLLARPYADQLVHQAAAHEHMQRQMLLERERYPHPALVAAQQEEYLRKLSLGNHLM